MCCCFLLQACAAMLEALYQAAGGTYAEVGPPPRAWRSYTTSASNLLFLAGAVSGAIWGILPVIFFSTVAELACTDAKVRAQACA